MAAEGPDSVEQQSIRGLDIDKTVKGFALIDYTFKNECTVSATGVDTIRWYQETSTDLTATAPQQVANISPLSTFPTLEPTWTRQTSYMRKYAAEGFISMEDIKSADIDVVARTLHKLTRAVVKQVDTRIWNVLTQSVERAAGTWTINLTDSAGWSGATAFLTDVLNAKKLIEDNNYSTTNARLLISPTNNKDMLMYLISTKGSSIPSYASARIQDGVVMNILGVDVVVSNNVEASGAALVVPQRACTWKNYQDTTSVAIQEPGIGTEFRVWEIGEAYLTDPKAVCFISGS